MTEGAHLRYVRAQGCVIRVKAADRCYGPIEAHHVRTAANSGMGMKPPPAATVGLCALHHRALHNSGRRTFETTYGVDLAAEARRLAAEDAPDTPQPPIEGIPTMSDIAVTTPIDATMDLLRERERELELEVIIATRCLATLRELIAQANARRPRTPRKLRTPEARIAEGLAEPPAPAPVRPTLTGALAALGRAVAERNAAERDPELEAA